MNLAPLTSALNARLACLPFAIADGLEPGAIHEPVQGPVGTAIWDMDGQVLFSATHQAMSLSTKTSKAFRLRSDAL